MWNVADGLWQLRGFPPHTINVYLAGDVLIDAGTRWSHRRIVRQLRGRTLSMIALTHCHPDHQGSAHSLCEAYGVPLACHSADVAAMEGSEPMQPASPALAVSRACFAGPPHPVARHLIEGDEIAGFRVVHAPGHTPGHVIFFRPSDRVAIAGDMINTMNLVTTVPGLHEPPWFFSADPLANRRSMRLLVDLEPSLVCVGHGPPLRGVESLRSWVDRVEGLVVAVPSTCG
jgi:glyoxylase-like metal-dependent hydrolase (beta-lactamase superfamily II)